MQKKPHTSERNLSLQQHGGSIKDLLAMSTFSRLRRKQRVQGNPTHHNHDVQVTDPPMAPTSPMLSPVRSFFQRRGLVRKLTVPDQPTSSTPVPVRVPVPAPRKSRSRSASNQSSSDTAKSNIVPDPYPTQDPTQAYSSRVNKSSIPTPPSSSSALVKSRSRSASKQSSPDIAQSNIVPDIDPTLASSSRVKKSSIPTPPSTSSALVKSPGKQISVQRRDVFKMIDESIKTVVDAFQDRPFSKKGVSSFQEMTKTEWIRLGPLIAYEHFIFRRNAVVTVVYNKMRHPFFFHLSHIFFFVYFQNVLLRFKDSCGEYIHKV